MPKFQTHAIHVLVPVSIASKVKIIARLVWISTCQLIKANVFAIRPMPKFLTDVIHVKVPVSIALKIKIIALLAWIST